MTGQPSHGLLGYGPELAHAETAAYLAYVEALAAHYGPDTVTVRARFPADVDLVESATRCHTIAQPHGTSPAAGTAASAQIDLDIQFSRRARKDNEVLDPGFRLWVTHAPSPSSSHAELASDAGWARWRLADGALLALTGAAETEPIAQEAAKAVLDGPAVASREHELAVLGQLWRARAEVRQWKAAALASAWAIDELTRRPGAAPGHASAKPADRHGSQREHRRSIVERAKQLLPPGTRRRRWAAWLRAMLRRHHVKPASARQSGQASGAAPVADKLPASAARSYGEWFARHRRQVQAALGKLPEATGSRHSFVVIVAANDDGQALDRTLRSLAQQGRVDCHVLVAGHPTILRKVKAVVSPVHGQAATWIASPSGPEQARLVMQRLSRSADAWALAIEPGDELAPMALQSYAASIAEHERIVAVYPDEDHLTAQGDHVGPWLKPDFSPDLLLSANLLAGGCIKVSSLMATGGLSQVLGRWGWWDAALRIVELPGRIEHVPFVLYHRGPNARRTPIGADAHVAIVEAHLERSGISAPRVFISGGAVAPTWELECPRTSVVIPTRNHGKRLIACMTSVIESVGHLDAEVIIVDTGSTEPESKAFLESVGDQVRVLHWEGDFNYSAVNNWAARHATGDVLAFLNNDIDVTGDPGWLEKMVRWAVRPGVGAVGCNLVYPGGTLQHGGVVVHQKGMAAHLFHGARPETMTVVGPPSWIRNVSAVTGACLVIRRSAFDAVGGFDESYVLAFSDVKMGLDLLDRGYRNVLLPNPTLIHLEGATRGRETPQADLGRWRREASSRIQGSDPNFHPAILYGSGTPQLEFR